MKNWPDYIRRPNCLSGCHSFQKCFNTCHSNHKQVSAACTRLLRWRPVFLIFALEDVRGCWGEYLSQTERKCCGSATNCKLKTVLICTSPYRGSILKSKRMSSWRLQPERQTLQMHTFGRKIWDRLLIKTRLKWKDDKKRQEIYVLRNTEARFCNRCCSQEQYVWHILSVSS
jgi:hypothetical protein